MQPDELRRVAARLAGGAIEAIEMIDAGGNSRVYRVVGADGRRFALKVYFRSGSDERDRLSCEFEALRFLWDHEVRDVPQPLAADAAAGCALYRLVEGPSAAGFVTGADIDLAVAFLVRLKELSRLPESGSLPAAAEACFSIQAIVDNIGLRLARLTDRYEGERAYPEVDEFLVRRFEPGMAEIVAWCRAAGAAGPSFDRELETAERTLSPSDFGFHNAVRPADGRLVFVDFEYFGWDDPAKMVVDVLLHPAMDLAPELKRRFVGGILDGFADYPNLADRVKIVYPLFGLKWCMIMLNEFLPEHLLRRRFAGGDGFDREARQAEQLAKVRHMLETISEGYEHFPYLA